MGNCSPDRNKLLGITTRSLRGKNCFWLPASWFSQAASHYRQLQNDFDSPQPLMACCSRIQVRCFHLPAIPVMSCWGFRKGFWRGMEDWKDFKQSIGWFWQTASHFRQLFYNRLQSFSHFVNPLKFIFCVLCRNGRLMGLKYYTFFNKKSTKKILEFGLPAV